MPKIAPYRPILSLKLPQASKYPARFMCSSSPSWGRRQAKMAEGISSALFGNVPAKRTLLRSTAYPSRLRAPERKAARKRCSRHIAWKFSKTRALIGRKVTGRHGVRNSRHLRHQPVARKTKDKSFAKYQCETKCFCNKIRTPLGAAA